MVETKTNLRLDDSIIMRYKIVAAKRKTSMAELIRQTLAKGIKELEKSA